jgi:hypothetical protein
LLQTPRLNERCVEVTPTSPGARSIGSKLHDRYRFPLSNVARARGWWRSAPVEPRSFSIELMQPNHSRRHAQTDRTRVSQRKTLLES